MKVYGFWYSHVGWIVGPDFKKTDYKVIGDYAKYPELVWLNKHYLVAPVSLAVLVTALGGIVNGGSILTMFTSAGLSTLFIGFFSVQWSYIMLPSLSIPSCTILESHDIKLVMNQKIICGSHY